MYKHSIDTFRRGFWKNPQNHRVYLDELGKRLGVRAPKDWGNITYKTIIHYGGGGLFSNHNSGSMFNLMKNVYPGSIGMQYSLILQQRCNGSVNGSQIFPNMTLNILIQWKIKRNSWTLLRWNIRFIKLLIGSE